MNLKICLLVISTLFWFENAVAGFEEGYKALQAKDYRTALIEARKGADAKDPRTYFLLGTIYQHGLGVAANKTEAFSWYEKAGKAGVHGAFAKLAEAYSRGEGVAKDRDMALSFARFSAKIGDPEGYFLVYLYLHNDNLSYLDSNGRADEKKYRKLASRPLSERTIDTDALDSLYISTDKGYPLAIGMLATAMGGRLGDGNRKRMSELLQKIPNQKIPGLEGYAKISAHMDSLGESYATPQLFMDAQVTTMLGAMIKGCGLNREKASRNSPKLVATRISRPLADVVYLPSNVPGYERSYLISGNWEEEWKYEVCDKSVSVNVRFAADGLGGASFLSEQTAKASENSEK